MIYCCLNNQAKVCLIHFFMRWVSIQFWEMSISQIRWCWCINISIRLKFHSCLKSVLIVLGMRALMSSKRNFVKVDFKYQWQFSNRISQNQWLDCKSYDLLLSKRPSWSLLDSFLYEVCIYTSLWDFHLSDSAMQVL